MAQDKKETRGRKAQYEQTPERIYFNVVRNLDYKKRSGKITEEEYQKLKANAKIDLIKSQYLENETNNTNQKHQGEKI